MPEQDSSDIRPPAQSESRHGWADVSRDEFEELAYKSPVAASKPQNEEPAEYRVAFLSAVAVLGAVLVQSPAEVVPLTSSWHPHPHWFKTAVDTATAVAVIVGIVAIGFAIVALWRRSHTRKDR
jgi:protein-S-isoprenylcysteine O-methyltransferase Ste14